MYEYINFSFDQIFSSGIRYKIHSTNEGNYESKKHIRATIEKRFFSLVFLNFLNIGKRLL